MHRTLRPQFVAVIPIIVIVNYFFIFSVLAEDKELFTEPVSIVITASRSEQPRDQVARSIEVIDSDFIEDHQVLSVLDILKTQANLDVVSSGTSGASSTVSIRGANPEHTLVLLDGIELNNPILPSRSFNFADLMSNDIERIEILRGPQSTLYGSDAMAGVINIISKKGEGPLSLNSSVEAGSHGTFVEQAAAAAGEERYNYALSVFREDVAGISAADSRYDNSEKDQYENSSYFARFGLLPTSDTDLNTIFRAVDSVSDLDNGGGAFGDDLNREQGNNQYFWGTSLNSKFFDDNLKSTVSYTLADQAFDDNNDPDDVSSEILRSKYQGRVNTVHGQLNYKVTKQLSFIAGAETKEESGESRYFSDGAFGPFESKFPARSATTNGYYFQSTMSLAEQIYLDAGIRVDQNSKFGDEATWNVAPVWQIHETETRIFSTLGTAFKAPSLFQLYSNFGSQELEPEKSLAVDVGIEQEIIENVLKADLTYFNQKFDNLISFDPNTFIFSNISTATTSGLESTLSASLGNMAEVNVGYTYLDATNDDGDTALLRRARNKISAYLKLMPAESWDLGVQTNYRSSRFDNDFSSIPVRTEVLAGYTTVDLFARYKISKNLELFARVENLLDRNYSEVVGYGTYGIGGFGGAKVLF